MGPVLSMSRLRAAVAIAVVGACAVVLSACSTRTEGGNPNLIAGKQMFVAKCGSCHVARPRPDEGQRRAEPRRRLRAASEGRLRAQRHRGPRPRLDPAPESEQPDAGGLLKGQDAYDVAAYVAASVSKAGSDKGLLATAVKAAGSGKPAVAKDGTPEIDADPSGQLAYLANKATAPAGS